MTQVINLSLLWTVITTKLAPHQCTCDHEHCVIQPLYQKTKEIQVFVRRFLQRYMQVPTAWALESRESIFSTLAPWSSTHGRVLPDLSEPRAVLDCS